MVERKELLDGMSFEMAVLATILDSVARNKWTAAQEVKLITGAREPMMGTAKRPIPQLE